VTGLIPYDEDIAHVIIFKLIELGKYNKRYVWVTINSNHGIGTGTDEWGDEDKVSAIIHMTNFLEKEFKFINGDFDEALEIYLKILNKLTDQLAQKLLKTNDN
jgi:hypothetical protein